MFKKIISKWPVVFFAVVFTITSFCSSSLVIAAGSNSVFLPEPGRLIGTSAAFSSVMMKGLSVNPSKPLVLDFLVARGDAPLNQGQYSQEVEKLAKYFLASLAMPEKELWVNLSPYEKNRIISVPLEKTDMGKDMLSQDYLLKQLTASLIYPEKELGRDFWKRVYTKAQQQFGNTQIPVNTFNKVWILADTANIVEKEDTAFIESSHLKVMLEQDFLALKKNQLGFNGIAQDNSDKTSQLSSEIIKEIVLPEIEKEVNGGKNFAPLRQVFSAFILAAWYKKELKRAILNQVYANQEKLEGINNNDPGAKAKIYESYLQAYRKGVFNYIKSEGIKGQKAIPRKYFSGGTVIASTHFEFRKTNGFDPALTSNIDRATVSFDPQSTRIGEDKATVAASNTPSVIDLTNVERLKAIDPEFMTEAGIDVTTTYITDEVKHNISQFWGEIGTEGRLPQIRVKDIPTNEEHSRMKYHYAIDYEKDIIYVDHFLLEKINHDPDRLFHFFERKIIKMLSKTADDGRADEHKYIRENKHLYAKMQGLFPSPESMPARILEKIRNSLLIDPTKEERTTAEYLATAREITNENGTILLLNPGGGEKKEQDGLHYILPPKTGAINANVAIYNAAKRAVNIIAINALDGIADYKAPLPATPQELASLQTSINAVQLSSKYNPITIAHLVVTILSVMAISGANNYYMNVSQFDPRKPEIEQSIQARTELAELERKYFFDQLITLLDTSNHHGLLSSGEDLSKWNGEEVLFLLMQEALNKSPHMQGSTIYYTYGSDHFLVWAPKEDKKDKDKNKKVIQWDAMSEEIRRYYTFYVDKVPGGAANYQYLLREQMERVNRGEVGARPFYAPGFDTPEVLEKKAAIIQAILEAKPKDVLGIMNNAEMLPRLDTIGKMYIISQALQGKVKIVSAHTARQIELVPDMLRDDLIRDKKVMVMEVGGPNENIAASYTRKGLISYLYGIINFDLLFSNTKELFQMVFSPAARQTIFSFLIRQEGGWLGPHALQVMAAEDSQKEKARHEKGLGNLRSEIKKLLGVKADFKEDPYLYAIDGKGEVIDTGFSTISVEDGNGHIIKFSYKIRNSFAEDGRTPTNDLVILTDQMVGSQLNQFDAVIGVIKTYVIAYEYINGKIEDAAMNGIETSNEDLGGIQLDADDLIMNVQKQGPGIAMNMDAAMLKSLQTETFGGLKPKVLEIKPLISI